jgi:hypothetical protein
MKRAASRLIVSVLVLAFAAPLVTSPNDARARLPKYRATATVSLSTWLKTTYPLQAAATQSATRPATLRWGLLIGINDYAYPTADNVGSRQDAESLLTTLVKLGWRNDHIIVIKDRRATASHIIDAIRWLSSKTNSLSTVVFHYSGHENWTRTLADGDNELKDVEIWAADNRLIIDGTVGREMNRVVAKHMWIDFSTCRAAGFNDYGMIKPGRILTYSSTVNEYSYESPGLHHSVFGWYLINVALYGKRGDVNHDGKVTVEEAYAYARPYVVRYTGYRQHPVIVDKVYGSMFLTIP